MKNKKRRQKYKQAVEVISEWQLEEEKKQLRPMGCITLDMEKLLEEMIEDHDLQWGEVLGLVYTWLTIHAQQAQEEYEKGINKHPVFYYGPKRK